MDLDKLMIDIDKIWKLTRKHFSESDRNAAERNLIGLRELLNSQPELEAGGSGQKESSKK